LSGKEVSLEKSNKEKEGRREGPEKRTRRESPPRGGPGPKGRRSPGQTLLERRERKGKGKKKKGRPAK